MGETAALYSTHDTFRTSTRAKGRYATLFPCLRSGYPTRSTFVQFARGFLILCWLTLLSPRVMAQPAGALTGGAVAQTSLMAKTADVVIFVKMLSADTASIGVSYNARIKHDRVKDDLRRLLAATGWTYRGDLLIDDASAHPDQLERYPATTGAMLTVTHAPQVRDGAPELLPYLQAFQAFSHVEVNFALPDLQPYTGVDRFENKALAVELYKEQGVYRYETEIRNHNDPLPELTATNNEFKPATPAAASAPKPAPSRVPWGAIAAAALCGILVGGIVFFLLGRRDARSPALRSPQRR